AILDDAHLLDAPLPLQVCQNSGKVVVAVPEEVAADIAEAGHAQRPDSNLRRATHDVTLWRLLARRPFRQHPLGQIPQLLRAGTAGDGDHTAEPEIVEHLAGVAAGGPAGGVPGRLGMVLEQTRR